MAAPREASLIINMYIMQGALAGGGRGHFRTIHQAWYHFSDLHIDTGRPDARDPELMFADERRVSVAVRMQEEASSDLSHQVKRNRSLCSGGPSSSSHFVPLRVDRKTYNDELSNDAHFQENDPGRKGG